MRTIHPFIYGIALISILSGCQQDPFGSGLKPGQRILTNNPNTGRETPKVFSVEAPDLIECTESMACGAEIRGHVPEPGTPVITIKGLPNGAQFDPSTSVLNYTPDFNVVDVANHPDQTMILIPLTVTVRSTADAITETSRSINLLVRNKLQPVELNVTGVTTIDEGKQLEQIVEVTSPDFPNGPLSVSAIGAPVGTEVRPVSGSNNSFRVRFTPAFSFAGVGDSFSNSIYYKRVKVSYQANLPLGQPSVKDVYWTVNDVRQSPSVSAPETLIQGLDVNFSIRAEDMNGEVAPRITVNSTVPFGRLTTTTVAETQGQGVVYPSRIVQVRWDQLRVNHLGTTTPIEYEICVQRSTNNFSHCVTKTVKITLKSDLHLAPKIDRMAWKSGDLRFLRLNEQLDLPLPVVDGEDRNLPISVKIESNQPNAIRWVKNRLQIMPTEEGILQFSLIAESIFGQRVIENFVLEVLPQSWAKAILLSSQSSQRESLETVKAMASVDLLSMRFQVSPRTLAIRDAAWITTEALSTPMFDSKMQNQVSDLVPTVVIASPLASTIQGKLAEEIKKFGIGFKGRLKDLSPATEAWMLSLNVDSRSDLESPETPAGLKGTLTTESYNPLVLDLDHLSSKCTVLFKLQKPGMSFPVGVQCQLPNRTLVVLGFEIADVLLDTNDSPILGSWMTSLTGIEGDRK
jgi:hypothetical protein